MTPDKYTMQETFIEVGDGHTLYAQEWGNPRAAHPIIFLHGGPGSGCGDKHRELFDPAQHRVIFFDQRGSGRSLPYGSAKHNTTDDLISDINKITAHFGIKKFVITGGSWGSCLALAYALKHPAKVEAMVLRGIFTGSQGEIDYFDKGEFRTFFPDAWEDYLAATPKSHHHSPTSYHYAKALGSNEQAARESAHAYATLERRIMNLDDRFMPTDPAEFDPASITVEIHYMQNRCFMPDRHILNNASKLSMPIWIVQGRYDFVCPPKTAYELHQKLPHSQLIWTTAGHSGRDRATYDVTRAILLQVAGSQAK